jgi:hypothetical protein
MNQTDSMKDSAKWAVIVVTGFVPVLLWLSHISAPVFPYANLAVALSPLIPVWLVVRWRLERTTAFRLMFVVAAAFALLTFVTHFGNGLTDERWSLPADGHLLWHGKNPYATLHYVFDAQTGQLQNVEYMWEFPLTAVFAWPFVDYAVPMLLCWLGMCWVLRDRLAGLFVATPFVSLLAVNGFGDYAPLLLLSIAYTYQSRAWWTEYLAVGFKQFAAAIAVVRRLLQRDWWGAVALTGFIAAVCLPFFLWNPTAFTCEALTFQVPSWCPAQSFQPHDYVTGRGLFDINYPLWVGWILTMWPRGVLDWVKGVVVRAKAVSHTTVARFRNPPATSR